MAKKRESSSDLKDQILETTEVLLRRYGAAKLSVVDVAREIGMSHGNVYRFFPSKTDLLNAIAAKWLEKVHVPLAEISTSDLVADQKLKLWFETLIKIKREKFLDDPQLFAVYLELAGHQLEQVNNHVDTLVTQIEKIIEEGKQAGLFSVSDARKAATNIFHATAKLHHPVFVSSPYYPNDDEVKELLSFLIRALN